MFIVSGNNKFSHFLLSRTILNVLVYLFNVLNVGGLSVDLKKTKDPKFYFSYATPDCTFWWIPRFLFWSQFRVFLKMNTITLLILLVFVTYSYL